MITKIIYRLASICQWGEGWVWLSSLLLYNLELVHEKGINVWRSSCWEMLDCNLLKVCPFFSLTLFLVCEAESSWQKKCFKWNCFNFRLYIYIWLILILFYYWLLMYRIFVIKWIFLLWISKYIVIFMCRSYRPNQNRGMSTMRTVFFTHSISEALKLKNKLYDSSQSRYHVILQRPKKI